MNALPLRQGLSAHLHGRLGAFELDASFHLAPTGITALVGPSGSGKTTLLRCIAGLTRLSGKLSVDGQVWQDERVFTPAHRRPVGFVFQDAGLLAHLSVKGNLDYAIKRASKTDAPIARSEIVDLLGLGSLLGRSTANLSGGERQRVALGRALLSRPQILLMDEPLSSLDVEAKAEILPYLEALHSTLAIPVVYVSHDPAEVARLADHVLTLRQGRIVDMSSGTAGPRAAAAQSLAGLSVKQKDALALAALMAGIKPAD